MKVDSYRELKVLQEISSNPSPTQRHLSQKLGVALGLTNLMIHRCIKKGYVKVVGIQKNRVNYLLTPRGISEKSRLTYEYLEYSLFLYRKAREVLRENLGRVAQSGGKNIVIFGVGEIAEIGYLTLKELGLNLAGVVDNQAAGGDFLGVPIIPLEDLSTITFDCGIIGSLNRDRENNGLLELLEKAGIPAPKIIVIQQKGSDIHAVIPGLPGGRSPAQEIGRHS